MKRIVLLSFCLLAAVAASEQTITTGTEWFNGGDQYDATVRPDGSIFMYSMDEGQESEFLLVPIEGMKNQFRMAETDNDGAIQPDDEEKEATVKLMRQDNRTVLAVYNKAGRLIDLYSRTTRDKRKNLAERWLDRHRGIYAIGAPVSESGHDLRQTIVIGDGTFTAGGQTATYDIETINDYPLDVITIHGTSWEGSWHLYQTRYGLIARPCTEDEYGYFDNIEQKEPVELYWADPSKGRWDWLSEDFNTRRSFSKPTLRLMRNSILAKHGYEFQSEDLKAYFAAQPWYKPAGNNAAVKLSFIEEMNVALIQAEEALSDDDRWISEDTGVRDDD